MAGPGIRLRVPWPVRCRFRGDSSRPGLAVRYTEPSLTEGGLWLRHSNFVSDRTTRESLVTISSKLNRHGEIHYFYLAD
jgi:hypothetical protein